MFEDNKKIKIRIMKRIGIILMLIAIVFQLSGQEATREKLNEKQLSAATDTNENTKVVVGKDLISVEDRQRRCQSKNGKQRFEYSRVA